MRGSQGRSGARMRALLLCCAAVALVCAVGFVAAPVEQPVVRYDWPNSATESDVALPLLPYQPVRLTASVSCAAAARLAARGGSGVVLSTVPLHADPSAPSLPGLRIAVAGDRLRVTSGGTAIATSALPSRTACRFTFRSDPDRTGLWLGQRLVGAVHRDVRPAVAGVFTEARATSGLRVRLVTDTRFQTTPSVAKQVLGWLCAAALLAMPATLWWADRRHTHAVRPVRGRGRPWWRPRAVDAAVAVVLVGWLLIGPATVDDGWIAAMIRSVGSNGYVGNVYRWLNAPEAPFSWSYGVVRGWDALAPAPAASMLWMRVPATALGLACWVMLSRGVLPRLGRFTRARAARWIAALVFCGWWLPFTPSVRPEPWVAAGVLAVFCAVEYAVATRRVLPLALALMAAAATIAETPAGLLALAPLLAGIVPLLRLLRARRDLHRWPLILTVVAAPAGALLLMFADQSLAAVAAATRVRLAVGAGPPWYQEYERYTALLSPGSFVGNLTLRGPVLATLLGLAVLGWAAFRRSAGHGLPGVAVPAARRLLGAAALAFAALTLVPTKWTYHFLGLSGLGCGIIVLLVHYWSRAGIAAFAGRGDPSQAGRRRAGWLTVAGIAGVTATASLVFAGWDLWPFVSDIGIPWGTHRPYLGPVPLAELVLGVGSLLVLVLTVALAWRRAGGRDGLPRRWSRVAPPPAWGVVALIGVLVALNLGTFARAALTQRGTFTYAGADVGALAGHDCGLAEDLRVEARPAAGLLPLAGAAGAGTGFTPVPAGHPLSDPYALQSAGQPLPGWRAAAVPARLTTGWYRIGAAQAGSGLPLVVTLSGALGAGNSVTADFARLDGGTVAPTAAAPVPDPPGSPAARDARLLVPPGSDLVRLTISAQATPFSVGVPRVPRTEPLRDLVPPGSHPLLDWPVAFAFPCLRPAPLRNGTAALPRWRIGPAATDTSPAITYAPDKGGPFAAPAMLVHQEQIPVYLTGRPTDRVVTLYRWVPIRPLGRLSPTVGSETVSSWHRDGHLTIPGPG